MKLKRLSVLLASVILIGCLSPATAFAEDQPDLPILYGDANVDGLTDVSDAVLIARYYAGDWEAKLSNYGKSCADVNLDGYVDNDDSVAILQYIAKLRPELGVAEQRDEQSYQAVNLMNDLRTEIAAGKAADAAFTDSQLGLTANLLRETSQREEYGNNLLISPLSISIALAMTANGANGQTKTEMENLLGGDLEMDALNAYYLDYTANLSDSKKASLKLANSIWMRDNPSRLQVPDAFLQTTANYYSADVFRAPFDDTTVTDINNWVNFNTHEMIPKLIDKITEDQIMYLINALAFEAEWSQPYRQWMVSERSFYLADGSEITVPMMDSEESIYIEDEYATGFIKPYNEGEYSFVAILPKESEFVTVSDYIGMMTADSLKALLESRRYVSTFTSMPKFSYDYDVSLVETLEGLGMEAAFDPFQADLTGLNSIPGTYISDVLHKTFITVDERGTKAGAVTAMIASDEAVKEMKYVTLNKPFIYMILDERTQLPIFIGYVMNPTET